MEKKKPKPAGEQIGNAIFYGVIASLIVTAALFVLGTALFGPTSIDMKVVVGLAVIFAILFADA